ncbi:MAG: C39 family peptidase [bacterium]
MVMIGSTSAAMATQQPNPILAPRAETILFQTESDFDNCFLQGIEYNPTDEGFRLTKTSENNYVSSGTITSPILHAKFKANNLVTSWNTILPLGTAIKIELQVLGKKFFISKWSPWYEMGIFGDKQFDKNDKIKKGFFGKVEEDELKLQSGTKTFRYRITLYTADPAISPTLHLFGVCYADMKHRIPVVDTLLPDTTHPSDWTRDLPVPYRSQLVEDKSISWRACHPTSLSMVLEYYGTKLPTAEVASCVWDSWSEIYGNWSFNAAFAGSLGYRSWIIRCSSFDPIKQEIAAGHPVILSIAFKRGVLSNAPIRSTAGHIIVCRGFTPEGDPICNDPAAKTEDKGHVVYKLQELERAWLAQKAAAVIVHPKEVKSKIQNPNSK